MIKISALTTILLSAALAMAACSKPETGAGGTLPTGALDRAIGRAIGDPATCVLLAEQASGRVLYHYGQSFNCVRGVPACDRAGSLSATQALALASVPGGRGASCPSVADGSRTVGWAEGIVRGKRPGLVYSAVMEGQTALPGHEMAARLEDAFQKAGL